MIDGTCDGADDGARVGTSEVAGGGADVGKYHCADDDAGDCEDVGAQDGADVGMPDGVEDIWHRRRRGGQRDSRHIRDRRRRH